MTDAEKLKLVGEAMFGAQWQSDLARGLDLSSRTVRIWAAGGKIPAATWKDIRALCEARSSQLAEVLSLLDAKEATDSAKRPFNL